jgi:hypothetical protein
MRPKWDERHGAQTYGELTIARALQGSRQQGTASPDETADLPLPEPAPWPEMDQAAYYGLLGEIVRAIAPNTESDPVAVLLQLLVLGGCAMDRKPYYQVEATRHHPNLYAYLVGKTSRTRKGTSADYAQTLITSADSGVAGRIMGGLSSGEGVIWQVRDPIYGLDRRGNRVLCDAGVSDKRLCIIETEFARALAKMGQEGNVLSAILRQAYDHGTLRTLVSGRTHPPVTATRAHVALVAHITREELVRLMTETEAANGFGNRVLWACVQRASFEPPMQDRVVHWRPRWCDGPAATNGRVAKEKRGGVLSGGVEVCKHPSHRDNPSSLPRHALGPSRPAH